MQVPGKIKDGGIRKTSQGFPNPFMPMSSISTSILSVTSFAAPFVLRAPVLLAKLLADPEDLPFRPLED